MQKENSNYLLNKDDELVLKRLTSHYTNENDPKKNHRYESLDEALNLLSYDDTREEHYSINSVFETPYDNEKERKIKLLQEFNSSLATLGEVHDYIF